MKKLFSLFIFLSLFVVNATLWSQVTYTYPLSQSFSGSGAGAPDLIQIPNNSGLTGEFVIRPVPTSTCPQGGNAKGYFFEDDAGLQFNSPTGFIDNQYSLSMIFQFDEFISPPPWVRVLSFTHEDDHGIYIYLTNPPTNGTLEFWPHGTVGTYDFFNTVDFYQLILVRQTDNLVKIYINGNEFDTYDDGTTMEYLPQPPDNYLIFFRDHPSVMADEASPGFVSNIELTNIAWTSQQVATKWSEFCTSLLYVPEPEAESFIVYPNPAENFLYINLPEAHDRTHLKVFDVSGRLLIDKVTLEKSPVMDVSQLDAGLYFLVIEQTHDLQTVRFSKQ